ncbi:hypothetical protein [Rodentibacter caecimuris]|uniref:hypothetical protein n=1 Tax=Rodentibacter caecimuris TaxID=1796644 RepID=UPI0013A090AA|nr:hypothetical protein [Rodentibacter heylii]MCQ9123150.1 hypothetical protein [Rodentibacter heylii]QIA76678.1 hypothetical protein FEE42_04560 [Rodentibacter heylii]
MHSVAPYAIRCFNRALKTREHKGYCNLSNIKSESLHSLILKFIQSHSSNYTIFENGKQVYRFSNIDTEPENIFCWVEIGDYGTENDIIDIDTGKVSFQKTQNNALINKFYLHFHIPDNKTTGLMFVHNYRYGGAKSLFETVFKDFFKNYTELNLQIFPFAHKKALDAWQNANVKAIKAIGYTQPQEVTDAAEALRQLSNGNEIEISIKPPRDDALGKLLDFLPKGSKYGLIQVISPETSGVKVEVEMNGSYRTFSVYSPRGSGRASYEIEIDPNVEIEKNMPEFDSIKNWVKGLVKDFKVMIT